MGTALYRAHQSFGRDGGHDKGAVAQISVTEVTAAIADRWLPSGDSPEGTPLPSGDSPPLCGRGDRRPGRLCRLVSPHPPPNPNVVDLRSKALKLKHNNIDICSDPWDKLLHKQSLNDDLSMRKNYPKGAYDGTVNALKNHAKFAITHKIFCKSSLGISIRQISFTPRISLETTSLLSPNSSPSSSPLLPPAKARGWK